jgi:hypothetical protein
VYQPSRKDDDDIPNKQKNKSPMDNVDEFSDDDSVKSEVIIDELENSIENRKQNIARLKQQLENITVRKSSSLERIRDKAQERNELAQLEQQLRDKLRAEHDEIKTEKKRILSMKGVAMTSVESLGLSSNDGERQGGSVGETEEGRFEDRAQINEWIEQLKPDADEEDQVRLAEEEIEVDSFASDQFDADDDQYGKPSNYDVVTLFLNCRCLNHRPYFKVKTFCL